MTKKRQHEFVIRVRLDKPCTASAALAAVKDTIHGDFYPYALHLGIDPEQLWVKSFRHLPKKARR
ncbi:MAG: hypothetical protein E5Y34_11090 [Mesorhizobium sp.]|uniref:hypothetical protein n=1 Tax=Mesorhizobium sp. TaxID=1871066 RepID=UPI0012203378|nr:hypothetical protein [Mesorhizobium sp.]TIN00993.1 MAG: hypothetical protein E5Y34_11090 [Mesorhizobium sp.]